MIEVVNVASNTSLDPTQVRAVTTKFLHTVRMQAMHNTEELDINPSGEARLSSMPSPAMTLQSEKNSKNDDADLGEVVDLEEILSTDDDGLDDDTETDDSTMAKQIEAAGECESLLGSDDSSDEAHLAKEEEYIIKDTMHRRNVIGYENGSEDMFDSGNRPDSMEEDYNLDQDDEFWNTLSPSKGPEDIVGNEMFKPQRGFADSPEPSFSDFFESSEDVDEIPADNDDELLTTDEDTETGADSSSTISDADLSAPLIAHIGSAHNLNGSEEGQSGLGNVDEVGSLRNAIPLLVIEDLDGRLIYARAGDGEAVFGSDGEFEFAGESEDDYSSDNLADDPGCSALQLRQQLATRQSIGDLPSDSNARSFDNGDDGDTTDELPDEDMPYPRLLIGSVAPRGGRNARRAREIAARSRLSSPRISSPSPSIPKPGASAVTRTPSTLSNVMTTRKGDSGSYLTETSIGNQDKAEVLQENRSNTPIPQSPTLEEDTLRETSLPEYAKPEMGQFIPAFSKSVHRAVIDGSHHTPSPFSSHTPFQRGFGKKRPITKPGISEDSLEHALSAPSRIKRKRNHIEPNSHSYLGLVPSSVRSEESHQFNLSPEPVPHTSGNIMDLRDVLDENLIWETASGGSSSDGESETPKARSSEITPRASIGRSKRLDRTKFTGRPGLNYNAFARWNRIPMGAFRDSQKQLSSGVSPPMSSVYATHQRPTGTFLLTHPFPMNKRQYLSNAVTPPARAAPILPGRDLSALPGGSPGLNASPEVVSPLNRTLADPAVPQSSAGVQSPLDSSLSSLRSAYGAHNATTMPRRAENVGDHTVVEGNFLVSPMLMPVKHSGKNSEAKYLGAPSSSDAFPQSRKVTKREKRERKAKREALKKERSLDQSQICVGDQPSPSPLPHNETTLAL